MILHLEDALPEHQEFELTSEFWTYYLRSVKRIQEGDELEIAGDTTVARVKVTSTDPFVVETLSRREAKKPDHQLIVAQALTRKNKFEEIIKIGTELGITDFLPVISERTVREPNNPKKQHRRWRKIILDSTRVGDREWAPNLHPLMDLDGALDSISTRPIFYGDSEGEPANQVFENTGDSAAIFVGPEGGFTDEEKKNFEDEKLTPVGLGDRNYRAETASVILSTLWLNQRKFYG